MTLKEQLEADVKQAMRDGDTLKRDTLRMVLAGVKNKAIADGGAGHELDDAGVLDVIAKAVKSRVESAQQYEQAGRDELAQKEAAEIEVLQGYLPKQLSEAATKDVVQAAIAETGAASKADIGKVMKAVMASHKGQVDGKLVQQLAGQLLG
jgi:uncharacterized protein YqeY